MRAGIASICKPAARPPSPWESRTPSSGQRDGASPGAQHTRRAMRDSPQLLSADADVRVRVVPHCTRRPPTSPITRGAAGPGTTGAESERSPRHQELDYWEPVMSQELTKYERDALEAIVKWRAQP